MSSTSDQRHLPVPVSKDKVLEKVEELKANGCEIYLIEESSIWYFDILGNLTNIYWAKKNAI